MFKEERHAFSLMLTPIVFVQSSCVTVISKELTSD